MSLSSQSSSRKCYHCRSSGNAGNGIKSPIPVPAFSIPAHHRVSAGAPWHHDLFCEVMVMMSSPARHKHLQLNKVSMDPDSFALFPVSSAAFQRCPPRGCMMALVVPSTSFPSAASRAGRKGGHFLLISIYTPFIFLIKKSIMDISLHLIGQY